MSHAQPTDLRVDTARDAAAIAAARSLIEIAEQADGRPPVSDQALLAVAQGQRELLRFFSGDDLVAVGIVGSGELDLVVAPARRRSGVGTAALHELLTRPAADASELRAWAHGENPAADALLTHANFAPVRSLFLMSLDPAQLPAAVPGPVNVPVPPGFALRTFDAARPDEAASWVRVNAAAFASHPEQGRITEADFNLMRAEPWFDASDLLMLDAARGLAAYTWVKTVPGEGSGPAVELYAIGVDPAHSGTGLGRALLEATLARMAQHSPASVALYVDGGNTRAVGMYERAGFTVRSRSRQWQRV